MEFVNLNYNDIPVVQSLNGTNIQKAIDAAKNFCLVFEVKSVVIRHNDRLIQVDHRGDRIIPPPGELQVKEKS